MQLIAKDLLNLDSTPNDSPPTWTAERSLLAAEVAAESLRVGGRLRLRVRGESMLPTLWPGDVVEIASCSLDEVRPGDIVLAVRDGRFFLHRIVGRSQAGGFLLRGDSMPAADPEFLDGALVGRLACPYPLSFWSWVIGRVLCYCGPARRLALRLRANRLGPLQPDGSAIVPPAAYSPPARGRGHPRHTSSISELPSAGA